MVRMRYLGASCHPLRTFRTSLLVCLDGDSSEESLTSSVCRIGAHASKLVQYKSDISQSKLFLSISIIDRDIDSYRLRFFRDLINMQSVQCTS